MPPRSRHTSTERTVENPVSTPAEGDGSAEVSPSPPEQGPVKPHLRVGPFGQILLEKLKGAPAGTRDDTVVMSTLRAIAPDRLKAAIGKATPKERNQLFAALPANQVAATLKAQTAGFLAPATPPPPPPSPAGGPPASILMTTYENVPYEPATADPLWSQKVTNGDTVGLNGIPEWLPVYDHRFEREGSLNDPMVGLTGWAIQGDPPVSTSDVWFVHPFGNDFQYYIAPDPAYDALLGGSNAGINPLNGDVDKEYNEATQVARSGTTNPDGSVRRKGLGLTADKGVIGVETDHGLVPQAFQNLIVDGARVATFGRWIVDCGHDDFHTEIHAPLLMAVATPAPPPAGRPAGASQMTQLQIMSRPYTVSQLWSEGNFVDHLLAEVAKVEDTILGIPQSWRVEAHPNIFTTPYQGRPWAKLLVQPPPLAHHGPVVTPHKLMVSFHFTHRTGVALQVFDAGNGTVGLVIVLGDLDPAPLPPKHDLTVQWSQLGDKYSYVIDALQIVDILTLNIAPAVILNRGILTDSYDPPSASSPLDNQNVAAPVAIDQLAPWAGSSEDDSQPFPIYGWMNVWWEPEQIVAKSPGGTGAPT